jgi:hypothetical protein
VQIVMRLSEPLAMTDDRGGLTDWTPAWQPTEWNYPGSLLSSASVNAITRIRLGVKAHYGASLAKFRPVGWAFTLRNCQFQTKQTILLCFRDSPYSGTLAGFCPLAED